MSPVTTEGFCKNNMALIFADMKFDQGLVMGPALASAPMAFDALPFADTLEQLHKRRNSGEAVQTEIDRYLLVLHMAFCRDPLLQQHPPALFVAHPDDVFGVRHLPDIGRYISHLIINQNQTAVDLMSKLIHYSIPYIKHNRMNFPAFVPEHASILPDIVNIMLASCLGLYPECSKQPLMPMRVKLVAWVHALKASGNALDLYAFCTANMCLLRIAMIEYFVFFILTHMPNETDMLTMVFGLHQNIADIFKQFCIICDTFRHQCLQGHKLDIADINAKAHVAIDKCNRVCKGKSRNQPRSLRKLRAASLSIDVVREAIRTPVLAHAAYFMFASPGMDLRRAHRIQQIHAAVRIHELPANLRSGQLAAVRRKMHVDTVNTIKTLYMYICMRCVLNNRVCLDTKMRVMADGRATCTTCLETECMVRVCVLGRIVRVGHCFFFYCATCMRVHTWKSSGSEFTQCRVPLARESAPAVAKCCCYCSRTTAIDTIRVLDDELGVIQEVMLCSRHMPHEHILPLIDNMHSLRSAVLEKVAHYSYK